MPTQVSNTYQPLLIPTPSRDNDPLHQPPAVSSQVSNTSQPLLNPANQLLTSPRSSSNTRTLVALNGRGTYTPYVCAYDAFGGAACVNSTLTVHPPCPGYLSAQTLTELQRAVNFTGPLSVNDTHAVLEVGRGLGCAGLCLCVLAFVCVGVVCGWVGVNVRACECLCM
jgi:hypothetical protein